MPSNRAHASLEKVLVGFITRTSMDEMDLRMALRGSRGGMDVVTAKVSSKLESFRDGKIGKVLVSEGYDFAFGNVASEFIFSGIRKTT